jgi:hypothetical protein
MILPLIQARPELRLWHLSLIIALFSGAMMAFAFTRFDEHPALVVTIERTAAFVPIFGISLTGLFWAFASPQRWSELDLALPASRPTLRRSRLIASWVAALAPATLGFLLLAALSSWVRESILPELGATLAGLFLFATLQSTQPRRSSTASASVHLASTAAFAGTVLLGVFVSPLAAILGALGISAVLSLQQWNCAEPILRIERASKQGTSFRTRWNAGRIGMAALHVGMLVLVSWSGAAPGAFSSALWLPWVLLGVQGVIFLELRSIRSLGWLPLNRRAIALRAVFVSLAILAAGASVSYVIIDTPLSWSHREAKLRLDYDSAAQRWHVQLTPPIDLYELVEAPAPRPIEEPPMEPSSEQSTHGFEATGLGFYRRNPYELHAQDSFEKVLATTERLVRDVFGERAPVERISEELLKKDAQGFATLRIERPPRTSSTSSLPTSHSAAIAPPSRSCGSSSSGSGSWAPGPRRPPGTCLRASCTRWGSASSPRCSCCPF